MIKIKAPHEKYFSMNVNVCKQENGYNAPEIENTVQQDQTSDSLVFMQLRETHKSIHEKLWKV